MDVTKLSGRYAVRRLEDADIEAIYALCSKNTLFYRHCPPFVTRESLREDMRALPPGKELRDKYFVGFYDGPALIAVLDLILAYPNPETAFIGFFMTEKSLQGRGLGTSLVDGLCASLAGLGFRHIRLGWVGSNPQAAHFWKKNGFRETGAAWKTEHYTVTVGQRDL